MKPKPITYVLTDTVSSDPDYNGDCDYCLIPMSAGYISYLLDWMDKVGQLCREDRNLNNIRCWDYAPSYFRYNDRIEHLSGIDGNPLPASLDEPVFLAADPQIPQEAYQRVECQTVQVSADDVWWSAYLKHTSLRVESAGISRKHLLKIRKSFGLTLETTAARNRIHPAVQKIHDLMYLDIQDGKEFYNPDKEWDSGTMAAVADAIAIYIPRPRRNKHAKKNK